MNELLALLVHVCQLLFLVVSCSWMNLQVFLMVSVTGGKFVLLLLLLYLFVVFSLFTKYLKQNDLANIYW